MSSEVGVSHQRTDPQPTFGGALDLVEREAVHVDQMRRRLDLELHQIEQVGAAGDELRTRNPRRGGRSFGRCASTFISEGLHACLPATSVIASTMLE